MKKLLKFTLYTLMSVGSEQFLQAIEPGRAEVHEPSGVAIHEAPVAGLGGKPIGEIATANASGLTDAQQAKATKDGNSKFNNDIKTSNLNDLQTKYEISIKTLEAKAPLNTADTAPLNTADTATLNKTKVALDLVNSNLAEQAPKPQATAQGFDLGSTHAQTAPTVHEASVTSTELTLFEPQTPTHEVKEPTITSNELVVKDAKNVTDTTTELTSQELTTLQNSAEKQFESGDRKGAAENTLATIDPNDTLSKDVQENLKAELEKGPENGQSWSDWFKSMYEKIINAMSDAMASAKSAVTGIRVITVIDPKTNEKTTTEMSKGVKTKSTTIDATGKVLSVDVYDPNGKNVIKTKVNEYDSTGKTVKTDTNQYDATGKTVLAKHTVELDPVTGRQLKSESINYDSSGKTVLRREDTSLNKDGRQQTVVTVYDATGKVPTSTVEYDQNHNITKQIIIEPTPTTIKAYDTKAKLDDDPTHANDVKTNKNQSINNPIDTRTPFTTLGIPENATKAQVRQAYAKQSKIHHPDRNPDYTSDSSHNLPKDNFNKINDAYSKLMSSLGN